MCHLHPTLPTDAAPLCQLSQGLSKSSNTVGLPFQSHLRTSRAFLWLCFCDIPRENRPFHISLPHATSLIPSTCLLQTLAPSVLFTCLLPHPHISLQCLLAIHNLGTSSEEVGLGALWFSLLVGTFFFVVPTGPLWVEIHPRDSPLFSGSIRPNPASVGSTTQGLWEWADETRSYEKCSQMPSCLSKS